MNGASIMSAMALQNRFLDVLARYVNGGALSRRDILLAAFHPTLPYRKNAVVVLDLYRRHLGNLPPARAEGVTLAIDAYTGTDAFVRRMMEYLASRLKEDLYAAYVHGSLGTGERIKYSDFDALAVLRNEVFESPGRLIRAASLLRRATRIMHEFDPLQHHGWFVTTQADLASYNNAWFPVEALRQARSLLPDTGREIVVFPRDSAREAREAFLATAGAVIHKLTNRRPPSNVYQLKGLLSEFMLLPALYVQAREGKGVFKKSSFDLARIDFTGDQWRIMDEVSEIRRHWDYPLSAVKRRALCSTHVLRKYFAMHAAPRVPEALANKLDQAFYRAMAALAESMRKRVMESSR